MSDLQLELVGEGAELKLVIYLMPNIVRMYKMGNHFAVNYLLQRELEKVQQQIIGLLDAAYKKVP